MNALEARIGFVMSAVLVLSLGVALIVAGLLHAPDDSDASSINRTAVAIERYQDMRAPDGHSVVYVVVP
jgi:hypothetical protein